MQLSKMQQLNEHRAEIEYLKAHRTGQQAIADYLNGEYGLNVLKSDICNYCTRHGIKEPMHRMYDEKDCVFYIDHKKCIALSVTKSHNKVTCYGCSFYKSEKDYELVVEEGNFIYVKERH